MEDVALHDEDELQVAAAEPADDAEAIARKVPEHGYVEQDNL